MHLFRVMLRYTIPSVTGMLQVSHENKHQNLFLRNHMYLKHVRISIKLLIGDLALLRGQIKPSKGCLGRVFKNQVLMDPSTELRSKSGVFIATFAKLRFVAAAVSAVAFRIGEV